MKADFKVGDGRSMSVDGFMVIDEAKLGALGEADIVALHRDGVLGLLHAHLLSLNHIGSLVDRLSRRSAAAAG